MKIQPSKALKKWKLLSISRLPSRLGRLNFSRIPEDRNSNDLQAQLLEDRGTRTSKNFKLTSRESIKGVNIRDCIYYTINQQKFNSTNYIF